MTDHPPILTVQQAADRRGVSPGTIHYWIKNHNLPAIQQGGKSFHIRAVDLDAFTAPAPSGGPQVNSKGALTLQEVADRFDNASYSTVYSWIKNGHLAAIKRNNRLLVTPKALQNFERPTNEKGKISLEPVKIGRKYYYTSRQIQEKFGLGSATVSRRVKSGQWPSLKRGWSLYIEADPVDNPPPPPPPPEPAKTDGDYLTVAEVARQMEVSRQTVHLWIGNGYLPATRKGRQYRIKKSDLVNFEPPDPKGGRPRGE